MKRELVVRRESSVLQGMSLRGTFARHRREAICVELIVYVIKETAPIYFLVVYFRAIENQATFSGRQVAYE